MWIESYFWERRSESLRSCSAWSMALEAQSSVRTKDEFSLNTPNNCNVACTTTMSRALNRRSTVYSQNSTVLHHSFIHSIHSTILCEVATPPCLRCDSRCCTASEICLEFMEWEYTKERDGMNGITEKSPSCCSCIRCCIRTQFREVSLYNAFAKLKSCFIVLYCIGLDCRHTPANSTSKFQLKKLSWSSLSLKNIRATWTSADIQWDEGGFPPSGCIHNLNPWIHEYDRSDKRKQWQTCCRSSS